MFFLDCNHEEMLLLFLFLGKKQVVTINKPNLKFTFYKPEAKKKIVMIPMIMV